MDAAYRTIVSVSRFWSAMSEMVPRGGIEPSPIQLKVHHFLNDDFPVYLPVDPALSCVTYTLFGSRSRRC